MAPVRSLSQSFAILRALGLGRAMTLSEVAEACGISPSSCLALLRTLLGEGVLEQVAGKRYVLSAPWAQAVAADRNGDARIVARARPMLDRAARTWQAPVGLWRVVGRDRTQLLALGESDAATRIHMVEGQRQPIGGGAVGRALAASQALSPAELARRFAAVRWQRPLTLDDYAAEVAEAARCGYAIDDGAGHAGVVSIAVVAPAAPDWALSATTFRGALGPDRAAELAEALHTLAADLFPASPKD